MATRGARLRDGGWHDVEIVFDGPAGRLAIRADGSPPVWVKAEGSATWPRRHVLRLGDSSSRSCAGEIAAVEMDADY